MAFNPDEYLATSSAFNPDAYLGSTQAEAPLLNRIGRQAGLTARYGLEGAGSVLDLLQTPIRGAINLAMPSDNQLQPVSAGGSIADALGLPQPQTATERVVGDVSRTVAGAGGVIGLANLARPITQAGQGIQNVLTANAPTQLAAATGGGAGSGGVREAGGGTVAQVVGGLAGGLAGSRVIKPTLTGQSTQKLQNVTRDKVLKEGQKAGYVALPSDVGSGKLTRAMETVSGKFKAQELASSKNQQVTNNLTRRYLGLSDDVPLSTETFDELRVSFAEPYRLASQLPAGQIGTTSTRSLATGGRTQSPVIKSGAQLVDEIKIARDDARASWKSLNSGMSNNATETRKAAQAADSLVNKLESQLDNLARASNQPELIRDLNVARQNIAKVHTVEKATNPITGSVNAQAIGKQVAKKAPITDELQLIGKFAQAFPKVTKQVSGDPNAFSIYDVAGTSLGIGAANPLLASLPALRVAGRYGVLSKPVQQSLVQPQYKPRTTPFVPFQGLLNTQGQQ